MEIALESTFSGQGSAEKIEEVAPAAGWTLIML